MKNALPPCSESVWAKSEYNIVDVRPDCPILQSALVRMFNIITLNYAALLLNYAVLLLNYAALLHRFHFSS